MKESAFLIWMLLIEKILFFECIHCDQIVENWKFGYFDFFSLLSRVRVFFKKISLLPMQAQNECKLLCKRWDSLRGKYCAMLKKTKKRKKIVDPNQKPDCSQHQISISTILSNTIKSIYETISERERNWGEG